MSPLRDYFESKVTVGNLLTISVFIIGGVAGYTRLESQVANLQKAFEDHKTAQSIERQDYVRRDVQDTRNRFIDEKLSSMDQKLDTLLHEVRKSNQ